ncbi:hypothetical protein [Thermoanaerobacterium sp. RBIITD]|uniref:hypothetical protein n=1 Tax=Thermoanaerobacterium sp. RBIITD TaxID=1550240 RepID=UPI000BB90A5B|nr:hypothetical protein [Thermoanaerobacterium sp. RBIITD]SNX53050.1 hypothetical protein SAMN05660242_0540 [Thermoanaerobacterium sp. RBIITD]
MKNGLEKLIEQADEVFINPGDILVIEKGYIDKRTRFDQERNIHIVKPITYQNGNYWYVCPDCGELHFSNILGKIQTGCCLDIDCKRHQYFKGNHYLIKRKAIILDDGLEDRW